MRAGGCGVAGEVGERACSDYAMRPGWLGCSVRSFGGRRQGKEFGTGEAGVSTILRCREELAGLLVFVVRNVCEVVFSEAEVLFVWRMFDGVRIGIGRTRERRRARLRHSR